MARDIMGLFSGTQKEKANENTIWALKDVDFSINDGFNPVSRTMEIDADAIGGPGYSLLKTLTETGADTVVKTNTKGGSFTLTPCTVAMNEEVIFQDGQINRVRVDISGSNRSTRYAA